MAWRWRKSLGRGPFRVTLSKKGIGWSVGIPGLRYGRTPDGRKYVSQGIPGTGIYRIKYLGGSTQPTAPQGPPIGGGTNLPQAPQPPPLQPQPALPPVPPPAPRMPHPRMPAPVNKAGGVMSAITRFLDRLF